MDGSRATELLGGKSNGTAEAWGAGGVGVGARGQAERDRYDSSQASLAGDKDAISSMLSQIQVDLHEMRSAHATAHECMMERVAGLANQVDSLKAASSRHGQYTCTDHAEA
jgi:hypothetical protein